MQAFRAPLFIIICAVLLSGRLQLNGISVQASKRPTIIRHIAVSGGEHDLEVEISATAPITPVTQFVINPDRLIVDFQEALPSAGLHKVIVNRGNLTDVRVGLLSADPRVTRVVLDLTSPTQFRVDPSGSVIIVKLGGESAPRPAPEPTADVTRAPPVETKVTNDTSLIANALPSQLPERNRAHWILPILTIASVLAMLVFALVSHILNMQRRKGT